MKALKVDVDVEYTLATSKHDDRLCYEIEFLALWLDKTPLLSHKEYSQDYLSFVTGHTKHLPRVTKAASEVHRWWGPQDLSVMKQVHGKSWALKLGQQLQLTPKGEKWITSQTELENHLKQYPKLVVKPEFGFAGRGTSLIEIGKSDLSKLSYPLVASPWLKRVTDIGAYWDADAQKISVHKNRVDGRFSFRGTKVGPLERLFNEQETALITPWINRIPEIVSHLKKVNATESFGIDAFIYEENGELKLHGLCEINYRKTMGQMAWLLAKLFGVGEGEFFLLGKTVKGQDYLALLDECKSEEIIPLSPPDNKTFWCWKMKD